MLSLTVSSIYYLATDCEVNVNERAAYPEHELFIYSILLGRAKLAKVFWAEGNVRTHY